MPSTTAQGAHASAGAPGGCGIGETEAGVGYLFGEGIREPLRIRAAWVPDEAIKALEQFVTTTPDPAHPSAPVLAFRPDTDDQHAAGGAA